MTAPTAQNEIIDLNKEYTFFSWAAQNTINPIAAVRGEGIYFWDADGKRYLDFNSQLMNVNVGHGNRHVIDAIKQQAEKLSYMYPGIATDPRGRLGKKLAQITAGKLKKTFFSLSGTEANESAMKIARQYTGRQKILGRFRAFHGQGFGAQEAGGDPRRLANEPGVPWVVHFHDPYRYRCLFCRELAACNLMCADHGEQVIQFDGPNNIAAIMLEGYSGSSGIIAPPDPAYWTHIRQMCDRYGIVLIVDEVMSGFGRTGKWFGVDHYPDARPDMITIAKGLTSGYVPLGATIVSEDIARHFDTHQLVVGGTYSSHALACAAALACIEVYETEHLIENSAKSGDVLNKGLNELPAEHPAVGDVRGVRLFQVLELVKNRETPTPLSEFNMPLTEPMKKVAEYLQSNGIFAFIPSNIIFSCPPLAINKIHLQVALTVLNDALDIADQYAE